MAFIRGSSGREITDVEGLNATMVVMRGFALFVDKVGVFCASESRAWIWSSVR